MNFSWTMLRATLKGSIYITLSLVLVKFLSLVYTSILARVLGPSGLGTLHLALLMVPWFIAGSSFSLQTVATQFVSSLKAKKKDVMPMHRGLLTMAFYFGLGATVVHFFLAGFVAEYFFHDAQMAPYVALASLIVLFSVLFNTMLGIERGLKKFKYYAGLEFSKQFLIVLIGILFVFFLGFGVWGALYALLGSFFLLFLFYFIKHRNLFSSFKVERKGVFSFGLSLVPVALFLSLFMSLDKFFLGFLQSKETVGFYVASFTLVNLGFFLVGGIKNTMFPFLSEKYAVNKNVREPSFLLYFKNICTYTLISIGLFMIGVMIFRHELVLLVFGHTYFPSIDIMAIMLYSSPFLALYIMMHTFSITTHRIKEATFASLFALVLSSGVYYLLTQTFGMVGTAYGLVISSFVLFICYFFFTMHGLRRSFSSIFGLFLLIISFTYFVSSFYGNFLWNIGLAIFSVLVYVLLLLLFGFLQKDVIFYCWGKVREYVLFMK
jgi:stage V sporulation protein B